jgi:Transposase
VERLLDAGLRVLAMHPNQVAAARERFRVSGGKSGRFDAFVLCELACTDNHRFRVLEPDGDQTKALRALVEQIRQLDRQIAPALRRHPDGEIFLSLFRDPRSVICAAELLVEIGDYRARYPTREALAGDAGQAAVAIESGKRKQPASGGDATSGYAQRSARSPTAPATGTPGRRTATPAPALAATTTRVRCAPSAAPGAA